MSKSYEQLTAQIEKLQREAEAARRKQLSGVVAQIHEMMERFDLTAEDLGFSSAKRRGRRPGSGAQGGSRRGGGRKSGGGVIRYRDGQGNEWTGHGRRPQWFLDALAAGRTPEEMAV